MANFLEHARLLTKGEWLWEFYDRPSEDGCYSCTPFFLGFRNEIDSLTEVEAVRAFTHERHLTLTSPQWVVHSASFSETHCLLSVSVYFHYEAGYDSVEEMTEEINHEMEKSERYRAEFEASRAEWEREFVKGWEKYDQDFAKRQLKYSSEMEARIKRLDVDEWQAEAMRQDHRECAREMEEHWEENKRMCMKECYEEELAECVVGECTNISNDYTVGMEAVILIDDDIKFSNTVLEVFTADKFPNRELDDFGGYWAPDYGEIENRAMERRLIERCLMGHPYPYPSMIEKYYKRS